jgi:hypothetical protein
MIILPFLFSLWFSPAALTAALPEPKFRFQYVPNEGAGIHRCTHERIRDLPDWEITCEGLKKKFVAHVIIRHHHKDSRSSIEILYWVTDRGDTNTTPPKFHSTTAWIHLTKPGEAGRISLSQGIENDYASLALEVIL